MKKKVIACLMSAAVFTGIFPPDLTYADTHENEYDAAELAKNVAGGFFVVENSYTDTENPYFFTVDNAQEAASVIDSYSLDQAACVISDELGSVVVQTDLTSTQKARLEKDVRVNDVEENYLVYGCSEDLESAAVTQWHLDALNVDTENRAVSGKKVKVELLDSGVSYVSALENVNRVDLTADAPTSEDDIAFASVLYDDNSGHGTALAGLIAADAEDDSVKGINPNADLYSVKILDGNLQASVGKVIEGIYWGIENGVDIINMSFGTEADSDALHDAVKKAADAGILLVAAAGNHADKGILYPAAYPEVIAVGATDCKNELLADSANGAELELVAPGNQIISTGMFDGYVSGSGTSLAAAEVTGIASLLMEQTGADAQVVRGLLQATAKDIDATDAGLVDYAYAKESFDKYYEAYTQNALSEVSFQNESELKIYDAVDEVVNGLWDTTTHSWLAEKANETAKINSSYIALVQSSAVKADNTSLYHRPEYSQDNGLHGLGRYPSNLYAIWKYANYINKGYYSSDAATKAFNDLPATARQKDNNLTNAYSAEKKNGYTVKNLLDACCRLIVNEAGSDENKLTNAEKKYLVVGFGCHLIGDIYAHRTLVPAYAYDNAKETVPSGGSYASGNSKDYASYLVKSHFDYWNKIADLYKDGTLTFPQLKYGRDENNRSGFNRIYEDNTDFCRERLNAALKCTREFLSRISSSSNNVATVDILELQTNVELIHYNDYMGDFD